MNKQLLEDKVIILVGASGGLGKVFAEEFAAEGATVVMTARNAAKLEGVAKEIEAKGGKVTGSVTSKTSYLINNDTTSTSSKNKKARELNIPILSEEDFIEMTR